MEPEKAIIIRDKTRLEQLIERFNSKAQAKFFIERSGGDFELYEKEHARFYNSLKLVEREVEKLLKFKTINRSFLPTYIFSESDVIIVIGQDGLVANTAKYVKALPIVAINPDTDRYDGVLLPHEPKSFLTTLKGVISGEYSVKKVTMAKVELNDGQSLLAFNDFYIGTNSHVSSRYKIKVKGREERQSSSGILVSTGAGSTGWLSSILNMANNINQYFGKDDDKLEVLGECEDQKLAFVVREPFLSKTSQINIGFGLIEKGEELIIESNMTSKGVIFSDGIESDFLNFNSGSTAKITVAEEIARLVV